MPRRPTPQPTVGGSPEGRVDGSVVAPWRRPGVVALAVAGRPGTADFLVAQTGLANACEAVQP